MEKGSGAAKIFLDNNNFNYDGLFASLTICSH